MKNTDHVEKCNFNIDTPNRSLKEIKIKGFYNIYASQKYIATENRIPGFYSSTYYGIWSFMVLFGAPLL